MRWYDAVSGILLVLSTIDFALAAPVPVQEKRQACVDVGHIPHDVITVLGKRGSGEDIEKLVEEFFGTWEKPIESSDAHASSSSALPVPDHGSTNVLQAPAPNQASSTAYPGLLMEPSSPSSVQGEWEDALSEGQSYKGDDEFMREPLHYSAGPSEYGSDYESAGAHTPQSNPNSGSSTGSVFDWNYWTNLRDALPQRPALPKEPEFGQAYDNQVEHGQQPNPGPSKDDDFDWNYWTNLEDPPPAKPASPKEPEFGLAHDNQVEHELVPPSPGAWSPKEPDGEVVPGPPPSPDPEFHLDHQSSSAGPRPEEFQAATLAAIYKMKGKAKESRRISDTARDGMRPRALRPAESPRSLDLGE